MIAKRGYWFTIDLANPLSHQDRFRLIEESQHEYWEYGTFMVVRTNSMYTCDQVHKFFDGVLDDSPEAVCLASDIFIVLDRLEVHFNSIQD